MHKKRKETTHEEIGERTVITTSSYIYIYIYINNEYKVCYHKVVTRPKVHEQSI